MPRGRPRNDSQKLEMLERGDYLLGVHLRLDRLAHAVREAGDEQLARLADDATYDLGRFIELTYAVAMQQHIPDGQRQLPLKAA